MIIIMFITTDPDQFTKYCCFIVTFIDEMKIMKQFCKLFNIKEAFYVKHI